VLFRSQLQKALQHVAQNRGVPYVLRKGIWTTDSSKKLQRESEQTVAAEDELETPQSGDGIPYEMSLVHLGFDIARMSMQDKNYISSLLNRFGYGTEVAVGKEVRVFNGKEYLLEMAFDADFAIVKAWKGDTMGNLIYKGTARNFNPLMAMAGKITIAEVEELVPAGSLDPNDIHTPGIYVHRIFQGSNYEKRIEQLTIRDN
jgi:hypothetical protein